MTYTSNTNDALADSQFIVDLLTHVATGGTLVQFCADREVHYKLVNRWLQDDTERAERYATALRIREDHAKDLIIAELTAYLRADVTKCFDENGNMKPIKDWEHAERRLLAGYKFREIFEMEGTGKEREKVHVGNMIEVKFHDKPRTIETFMRHLAMLVDRKQHEVASSLIDLVTASMKAAENKV